MAQQHGYLGGISGWVYHLLPLLPLLEKGFGKSTCAMLQHMEKRPDLHAPIIDFTILRPELVIPGYIFLAPYRNVDPGPYIYDNYGNLVWSGAGSSGPKTAHAPRVCTYKGADHLCYFQGEQHQGFARGHGVIMDQNYRIVKTVESSGAGASSDMHEFKMTPYSNGTTVLMTVYQPRQYDLTTNPRFNVERGMGWIVEGVFQEVDIETGKVMFEWRSLDHVDPGLSWTMPGTTDTSGDGLHEQSPWDYFHINSIDKNVDGDYLISARHVGAIYKLSGRDGSIIWQMGGNAPTLHTTNFVFSYQHHARWVSENATHTILTFYDNASNTFNSTGTFSHGWMISISHVEATATMIKEWGAPEPEGGLLSGSQGNMQLLPNGGCHIGWGEHAYFSEHTASGSAVMYAKVADKASNVMIYRSNKFNWTAQPTTKPALWTYSRDGSKMVSFVSWNGATEVRNWEFYTSATSSGPWALAGMVDKHGFETEYRSENVSEWSYARALDGDGRILETSVIARTFRPSGGLVDFCDDRGCAHSENSGDLNRTPYEEVVNVGDEFLSPLRGFNTSGYFEEDVATVSPLLSSTHQSEGGARKATSLTSAITLVLMGLLSGIFLAGLTFFLWTRGALSSLEPLADAISRRTGQLGDSVTKSAFGSKVFGKYTRVREKEMDGFESGSSSSTGSGRVRQGFE
ncbi:hypothetical protein LTR08_006337 [Meristemomyces frigidus]|nr:hypothetical protein LTR08_006337 [Meristemomyces frigidus]